MPKSSKPRRPGGGRTSRRNSPARGAARKPGRREEARLSDPRAHTIRLTQGRPPRVPGRGGDR